MTNRLPHLFCSTTNPQGGCRPPGALLLIWFLASLLPPLPSLAPLGAQEGGGRPGPQRPTIAVGQMDEALVLDGRLNEPAWATAPVISTLTMLEPTEGGIPAAATRVRILANTRVLVVGIEADDPDPGGIVSTSKARDPELKAEDYLKIVLDPFLDGRSGYIFAINPGGARYDALVARRGEGEDPQWDAVWEARTSTGPEGWTAEIRIPLQSLSFDGSLDRWGFNIERRVERLQEVSRWASPFRDAKISQTSRAGFITDLPAFDTGLGLTVRPALVAGGKRAGEDASWERTFEPSLDVFQRIGDNTTAMVTANTDFAETEVDTRKTNLTRFPLFFPEKRTFFLEGSDIFDFGVGLSSPYQSDVVPFFSRRIGLYEGEAVPLQVGGKVSGKTGNTNFGALVTRTGSEGDLGPTTMGAFRIRQNVLEESNFGFLGTFGDPAGERGSYLVGADATYQTSRMLGSKNFIAGLWGLVTDREGAKGDKAAFGGMVDYPNDTWDVALTFLRIGDGFDPALGFVPRKGYSKLSGGGSYSVYPSSLPWLRMMSHELRPSMYWGLDGKWESYRVFTAPINWRLESGDRIEINVNPEGERLDEPFEIADGVIIQPGTYHFTRYRLEWEMAAKRRVSGQLTWWFGSFYDGSLHQLEAQVRLRPSEWVILDLTATRNVGEVEAGAIDQQVYGLKTLANISPDLQLTSFVQYDDESNQLGTNTRLRWTFHPLGELFLVYNYNVVDRSENPDGPGAGLSRNRRWELDATQFTLKVQYALRH